jgi:hypothetical protein
LEAGAKGTEPLIEVAGAWVPWMRMGGVRDRVVGSDDERLLPGWAVRRSEGAPRPIVCSCGEVAFEGGNDAALRIEMGFNRRRAVANHPLLRELSGEAEERSGDEVDIIVGDDGDPIVGMVPDDPAVGADEEVAQDLFVCGSRLLASGRRHDLDISGGHVVRAMSVTKAEPFVAGAFGVVEPMGGVGIGERSEAAPGAAFADDGDVRGTAFHRRSFLGVDLL